MAKFKTRARAVDMLGRQQIAGVANAISELFKNAYDAYADNVIVDYFRSDGLFVLRDDGVGMTEEDFLERWLTLGTESKVAGIKGIKKPYEDKKKDPRVIIGEKGIGRLAIAIIGPQVLVLSRAERDDGLRDSVTAFIHWGLFEAPGVNLDDIEIPVGTFPGGKLPSSDDVDAMVDIVRENTKRLEKDGAIEPEIAEKIFADLDVFDPEVDGLVNALGAPGLIDDGRGTHFYILPSNTTIRDDLESDMALNADELSQLSKLLMGFANTMSPGGANTPIKVTVNFWRTDDSPNTLISEDEFWTPEELRKADHRITGTFDETGQFVGKVRIYDKVFENHVIPAPSGIRSGSTCGPFEIDFAYVMGRSTESSLALDEFAYFQTKLRRIGGLYVYKDGIRILPYGDADVDYLEIEKRRTFGAGYYFFSHRRLFGVIRLSNQENSRLVEKAGREGFQTNKAYREFRQILINFFIQLAADFFRRGASSEYYQEKRNELIRLEKARKEHKKEADRKRREFESSISTFFDQLNDAKPSSDVSDVINSLTLEVEKAIQSVSASMLNNAETKAINKLNKLRESYRIEKPGGVGLTSELRRDWSIYQEEYQKLENKVFYPTDQQIGEIIDQAASKMKIVIDERERVERLVQETVSASIKNVEVKIDETQEALNELQKRIENLFLQAKDEMKNGISFIEDEIRKIDLNKIDKETINQKRRLWEERVRRDTQGYDAILSHIKIQLEDINWYRDDEGDLIGNAEITAALEEEVLGLQETIDISLEAAQLGKAIEVISHEFNLSIATLRENISRLRNWAALNPELAPIYNNIRVSFDHLDGYLKLFTPLQRRLQRTRTDITGAEIHNYLKRLFGDRLSRENMTLEATDEFKEKSVFGFRSTFYPVFINLVDNAIYWVGDQRGPKTITLDANERDLIVSDTGPGIARRDRQAIFERGFTRKPGGTGLGLFISREGLKAEGYELLLDDQDETNGAKFMIREEDS
jgi:signal transduction histidine kinase